MKKYKEVYNFKVLDEILNGERVFVVDREMGRIQIANNLSTGEVLPIVYDKNENNRYEFYKVVRVDG